MKLSLWMFLPNQATIHIIHWATLLFSYWVKSWMLSHSQYSGGTSLTSKPPYLVSIIVTGTFGTQETLINDHWRLCLHKFCVYDLQILITMIWVKPKIQILFMYWRWKFNKFLIFQHGIDKIQPSWFVPWNLIIFIFARS